MLNLIGLNGAVSRNNVFEDNPERGNIPLPVTQFVKPSALRILRLHRERPIKGAARCDDAQVAIEHDKRLPNGVNDGLSQGMPACDRGQRIVIRHAEKFLPICALDFITPDEEGEPRRPHIITSGGRSMKVATFSAVALSRARSASGT